jgi:hypothetical protein
MATEPGGDTHFSEIVDAMIGDLASGAFKSTLKAAFSSLLSNAGHPWQKRYGAMWLGTPDDAEAIYWASVEAAETEHDCSVEAVDQYLIAAADLPSEKQNVLQINTIQSWILELKKAGGFKDMELEKAMEMVIKSGAKVIASHARRIARNRDAWIATIKIQDLEQPVLRHDYEDENRELEARHEIQKRHRRKADIVLVVVGVVAIIVLLVATVI